MTLQIKSIKSIKQIGVFSDFSNGGSKRFEKLTLLFGSNANGKTTLSDIFESLATDNSNIIVNRKTIPSNSNSQIVELSLKKDNSEQTVKFHDGHWDPIDFRKNIKVFGTDFIHRNVFTGLMIERQNKENFTDFILGEVDTTKAKELEKVKSELRNSNLNNAAPPFTKNYSPQEIDNFINLQVTESKVILKEELSEKNVILVKEKDNLKNAEKILLKKELPDLRKANYKNVLTCVRYINSILLQSFDSIKDDVLEKLNKHIQQNFTNSDLSEKWIDEGLKICKHKEIDANCPFCGQQLKNAEDLINTYQQYFNEEYSNYIVKVENELGESIQKLRQAKFAYGKYLSDSFIIVKDYEGLINDDDFKNNIESFENVKNDISDKGNKIELEVDKLINQLEKLIENKKRKPHLKSEISDYSLLNELLNTLSSKEIDIEVLHNACDEKITLFKEGYKSNKKIDEIEDLENQIKIIDRKIKRIEQDSQCIAYNELKQKIIDLNEKKKNLNEDIEISQSEYLDKYFEQINSLFKQFGSYDFKLERNVDNRGNKKVYSLSVKFKNQKIRNEQLPIIFSESDRRALALSIFWSRININDDDELESMILLFDDPATSFDDNRITKTVNLLKATLSKVSQIIVLTHYSHFIKRFLEITKQNHISFKLIEIKKDSNTAYLDDIDKNKFILDEHNIKFLKIYDFINRRSEDDIKSDLRPYLENQLKRVFNKQIIDFDIDNSNLENLIDNLKENDVISDAIKEKLHEFRKTLNPDSHIFTTNIEEDFRNIAKELIEIVHSLCFSTN